MRVPLAILVSILLSLPAAAQTPLPIPGTRDDGSTVLHLGEFAERILRQDRLTVQLRAEASGPDAGRVQAEINRRMTAALEQTRRASTVRAETRGYWVNQERPPNQAVRWRGQQMLVLTSTDTAAALALAGELQQAGLVMSGMHFDLSPDATRAAEDELTAEAIRRLRERTERVATTMGLQVRHIRDLRVGQAGGGAGPRPMMLRTEAAGGAAPPVAEPGETTVRVSVDAEVVLAPRARP
jgi:predicted secreted protein